MWKITSDTVRSIVGIGWSTVFAWGAAYVCAHAFDLSVHQHGILFSVVLLLLYGLLKYKPGRSSAPNVLLTSLTLLLLAVWFVLDSLFGDISINAILFHMNYEVGSNEVAGTVVKSGLIAFVPFVLMLVSWSQLSRMSLGLSFANRLLPVVVLVGNPLFWIGASHAFSLSRPSPVDLHAQYVVPHSLEMGDGKPKNLIHIFLESTERTFLDTQNFGDVAAPLERLQRQGWSASNIDQVELTSWTLAGHVASTCGTPLFPMGVIRENSFGLVEQVLPAAECLGDLLAGQGYTNVFLKGASLDFAGTRGFARSHGYHRLLGFDELYRRFPGRFNNWGLHDEDLFSVAYDEVSTLRASGNPYSLMLTTLGGHAPHGYVSPVCTREEFVTRQPNETLKAFACTNLLLERFVERLRSNGLLENTLVVIQSDHFAMRNDVYETLRSLPRRNLFLVLGSERSGAESKPASTVDIYPTIVKDLGFDLPDGRLGLGRALQGQDETLVGRYGVDGFNQAIQTEVKLRDRLWGLEAKTGT